MAYRDSTSNTGNSTTPSVAVPAGVAANDIVIITIGFDTTGGAVDPGDLPTGFVELGESTALTTDGHTLWVGYKRLTGSDAGTYTFGSIGAANDWVCQAFAFSGRHTTNPPVTSTLATNNTPANDPTVTSNGVTAVAGDDLLWVVLPDKTTQGACSMVAPTNFTEAEDATFGWSAAYGAYRNNVSAGATGSVSAVLTTNGTDTAGWGTWLIRIPAAAGAAASSPVFHRPARFITRKAV
jgi:hypothetical protein